MIWSLITKVFEDIMIFAVYTYIRCVAAIGFLHLHIHLDVWVPYTDEVDFHFGIVIGPTPFLDLLLVWATRFCFYYRVEPTWANLCFSNSKADSCHI